VLATQQPTIALKGGERFLLGLFAIFNYSGSPTKINLAAEEYPYNLHSGVRPPGPTAYHARTTNNRIKQRRQVL